MSFNNKQNSKHITTQLPSNRSLPSKEAAAFKELLSFFENKLYKKALKQADQILKAQPDHGETLAIKGLVLANLPLNAAEPVEPLELIKQGIRNDITSFICWQILGLYHRLKKNYSETLKCYRTALKIDPSNIIILKDLALLQAHERQFSSLVESRTTLIKYEPYSSSLKALSIAFYLAGNALSALNALEQSFESSEPKTFLTFGSQSELKRFKWKLESLAFISTTATNELNLIRDLDIQDEAIALYDSNSDNITNAIGRLLQRNPHLPPFHRKTATIPVSSGSNSSLLPCNHNSSILLFEKSIHPSNNSHCDDTFDKAHLKFMDESSCKDPLLLGQVLEAVILKRNSCAFKKIYFQLSEILLEKAPRSLYKIVSTALIPTGHMCLEDEYIQIILESLTLVKATLSSTIFHALILDGLGKFENAITILKIPEIDQNSSSADCSGSLVNISNNLNNVENEPVIDSIEKNQESIDLKSENSLSNLLLIDALCTRSKIYKHLNKFREAAEDLITASEFQPGDRFLNALVVRRLLRSDDLKRGEEIHSKFVKKPVEESRELQMSWYLIRKGEAFWRIGQFSSAIEEWKFVIDSYLGSSLSDDVFDFHGYALRRGSLVGYVELLSCTPPSPFPIFYKHPIWQRTACNLLLAYLYFSFIDINTKIIDELSPLISSIVPMLSHWESLESKSSFKIFIRRKVLLYLYNCKNQESDPFALIKEVRFMLKFIPFHLLEKIQSLLEILESLDMKLILTKLADLF